MRTPGTRNFEPLAYFEAHFDDGGDDCYPWPFHRNGNGYAPLGIGGGKRMLVHVLACERAHGPCPPGMEACHSCVGNKACWNPRHLRWDTHHANVADRDHAGNTRRGERHGRAKLTWATVDEARSRYATGGVSQQALADEYGVAQQVMSRALRGITWIKV